MMTGATKRDLETLYRTRYAHFVRVATAFLHDEEEGIEAVQDAFASALRRRRTYRGEGPLDAWVWRIVVNAAKKRRSPRDEAALEPIDERETETATPVRTLIAALPERQRLVLFLRYYADLDYESIAAALEISPGTVGASLHAAHASLRKLLEEAR